MRTVRNREATQAPNHIVGTVGALVGLYEFTYVAIGIIGVIYIIRGLNSVGHPHAIAVSGAAIFAARRNVAERVIAERRIGCSECRPVQRGQPVKIVINDICYGRVGVDIGAIGRSVRNSLHIGDFVIKIAEVLNEARAGDRNDLLQPLGNIRGGVQPGEQARQKNQNEKKAPLHGWFD